MNSVNQEKGQSLIEIIVALGIFIVTVLGLAFFALDSYVSGRLSSEITKANFLAEEGLEAARSIRDSSWANLMTGNHGLAISGGHWIFQGAEEDISNQLKSGKRTIQVEDIEPDQKKITSKVNWQFTEARSEEIKLVSYLTNWQKGFEIRKPTSYTDFADRTTNETRAYDLDGATWATTRYDFTANPSITFHTWQSPTRTYNSLTLKYRYHADGAINDTYAIAYSTTGCAGIFTDLISPTSAAAPDTTVSVNLSSNQDLSQLCLKIYSRRIGPADNRRLYTRDIWTEGTF